MTADIDTSILGTSAMTHEFRSIISRFKQLLTDGGIPAKSIHVKVIGSGHDQEIPFVSFKVELYDNEEFGQHHLNLLAKFNLKLSGELKGNDNSNEFFITLSDKTKMYAAAASGPTTTEAEANNQNSKR